MEQFTPYRRLLAPLALAGLEKVDHQTARAAEPSILIAAPAAHLLIEESPSLYQAMAHGFEQLARWLIADARLAIADTAGHRRPVYLPVAVHIYLAAFERRYETMPPDVWGACEQTVWEVTEAVRAVENYADAPPPPARTDVVLWQALCLWEQAKLLSRDADIEWIESVIHQVVSRPGQDGALHPRAGGESLDGWTYRELCGLHALANLALASRNRAWSKRVQEIAMHHLEHTQPDHVTTQPWAVFAFLWSPRTRSFAEQQIHDATVQSQQQGQLDALPAMLLADAVHALAAFNSYDER